MYPAKNKNKNKTKHACELVSLVLKYKPARVQPRFSRLLMIIFFINLGVLTVSRREVVTCEAGSSNITTYSENSYFTSVLKTALNPSTVSFLCTSLLFC